MSTQTNFGGAQASTASTSREPQQRGAGAAMEKGKEIQNAASEMVGASAEAVRKEASEFVEVAKTAAAEAGDRIQNQVSQRKQAGADYVENFADAIRRAAGEFESDTPIVATYIRKAAAQVDSIAEAVREGDLTDLVRGAQSFAQRQPTAFLGLAVLAGFGAVRFLKSSTGRAQHQEFDSRQDANRSDFGGAREGAANFGAGV
jgi:hypothetical protein